MRTRTFAGVAVCAGALLSVTAEVRSQEHKHKEGDRGPEAAMMEAFKAMAAPNEYHAHLKPLAGQWNQLVKWRMSPEQPWVESKGTSESKWILGGRFLVQTVKGELVEGERFEGFGLMGYDKLAGRYTSIWVDNMSTATMSSTGTCDPSGKVFTFHGKYMDPMTRKNKKSKSVIRIIDNNRYAFEMYDFGPDGKEFKTLEVVYTRK